MPTNNTSSNQKQQTNFRIDELNAEIERTLANRRIAEQELFQLEADTTIKNSEIKNLEVSLIVIGFKKKSMVYFSVSI